MEVTQELIDSLMAEHEDLMKYLHQMDPTCTEYPKVQRAVAENWETIQKVQDKLDEKKSKKIEMQDKLDEKKSKKIELAVKIGLAGLGIVGTALEIYLRTKSTKSVLDRIYAYETEAILPQNKVNMGTRLLTDKSKI